MRMWMFFLLLDPRAFTSSKHVGLENKRAKSTRDGNFMSVFPLKSLEPASFGLFSANYHSFTPEISTNYQFQKVEVLGPKSSNRC